MAKQKPVFVDVEFVGTDVVLKKVRVADIGRAAGTGVLHLTDRTLLHSALPYITRAAEEMVSIRFDRPDPDTRNLVVEGSGEVLSIKSYVVLALSETIFSLDMLPTGGHRLLHTKQLFPTTGNVSEIRISPAE